MQIVLGHQANPHRPRSLECKHGPHSIRPRSCAVAETVQAVCLMGGDDMVTDFF